MQDIVNTQNRARKVWGGLLSYALPSSRERHSCKRWALFSYVPCPRTGCSPASGVAGRAGSMVKGRQDQRPCQGSPSLWRQPVPRRARCLLPLFVISLHSSLMHIMHSCEGQLSMSSRPVKPCLPSTVGTGAHTGTKLKEDSCIFNTLPIDHRSS